LESYTIGIDINIYCVFKTCRGGKGPVFLTGFTNDFLDLLEVHFPERKEVREENNP
jgi:hypothetical protein